MDENVVELTFDQALTVRVDVAAGELRFSVGAVGDPAAPTLVQLGTGAGRSRKRRTSASAASSCARLSERVRFARAEAGIEPWTRGSPPVLVPLGRRPDRRGGRVRGQAHRAGDPAARVRRPPWFVRDPLLLLQPRGALPAQPDDDRQRGDARRAAGSARGDAEAARAAAKARQLRRPFTMKRCAAGPRWRGAMPRPRSRPYLIRYERFLRPCLAHAHRTPATRPHCERTSQVSW